MKMKDLCFAYYSAKGFDNYGEYGHPEIRVFEKNYYRNSKGHVQTYMGSCLLSFKGQVDKRQLEKCEETGEWPIPYGIHIKMEAMRSANGIKFLSMLNKFCNDYICSKNIVKFLKKKKVERYYHTDWLDSNCPVKEFIPYKHRKNPEFYMEANKKGLKLGK